MSAEKITYQDILQLVQIINSAECELHLKYGDLVLDVIRHKSNQAVIPQVTGQTLMLPSQEVSSCGSNPVQSLNNSAEAVDANPLPAVSKPSGALPEHVVVVKSPMVGTFYRAPSPGAKPFVEVGQRVSKEDTVCIIDVMKIMNSIPAGTDGVVTHIFVEDGAPVEFGQPLMAIDPTSEHNSSKNS
ncbi:MAG: acetyl-CoA carboxylase biotin carboxyl carrier protein [Bacillota bacterium]